MASGAAIQGHIGFVCMRLALGATESGLMPVSWGLFPTILTRDADDRST